MGVQGLWDLASPAGQRVNLSALENKVVAVDASIWMYHFLKAMRDESGNMMKGAHILGFFRRICKLLYLKIRPVFVFDGPPPALKRRTLQLRAKQRDTEERQRRKAVEKLLRNQLQLHILKVQEAAARAQATGDVPENIPADVPENFPAAAGVVSPSDGRAESVEEDGIEELHEMVEDAGDAASDAGSGSGESVAVADASDTPAQGSRRWERLRRRNGRVPEAFRGFMARRRGVAEVVLPELPAEPLRDILQVPDRRQKTGRMREPDEWKGYVLPGGEVVTIPLDGPVQLEDFEKLDPKTKYMLLQRAQEAWYGESRLKAVQAKDNMSAFVNVQLETFLRHIRTNNELAKVKRLMAEEVSHPVGDGFTEGDVYTPPSFLRRGESAASASSAATQADVGGASAAAASGPEASEADAGLGGRGRGRGRGEGRRNKGPKQLGGADPAQLRPLGAGDWTLQGKELPQLLDSAGGMDLQSEDELQEAGGDPLQLQPEVALSSVEDAEDLFGAAFFAAEEGFTKANSLRGPAPIEELEVDKIGPPGVADASALAAVAFSAASQESDSMEQDFEFIEWESTDELAFAAQGLPSSRIELHGTKRQRTGSPDLTEPPGHAVDAQLFSHESIAEAASLQRSDVVATAVGDEFIPQSNTIVTPTPTTSAATTTPARLTTASTTPVIPETPVVTVTRATTVATAMIGVSATTPARTTVAVNTDSPARLAITVPTEGPATLENKSATTATTNTPFLSVTTPANTASTQAINMSRPEDSSPITVTVAQSSLITGHSAAAVTSSNLHLEKEEMHPGTIPKAAAAKYIDQSEHVSAAATAAAAAAAPAALPPQRGPTTSASAGRLTASDTSTDKVWCTKHFQYRWRCRQDGLENTCDATCPDTVGSSSSRDAAGRGAQQGGSGNNKRGRDARTEETVLGDAEMEELEFERLAAELEDERQELRGEVRRAKRGADFVTPEMQADVEALLEAFGIPFVHAPAEAEAQCAFLAEARLVDAVASDDSDVLVFGAREVYRRLFSEDSMVECYTQVRLEARLGLNRENLSALAMLMGCDYTTGVHGVGVVNGLEIVQAFGPSDRRGSSEHSEAIQAATPAGDWIESLRGLRSWSQNIADWGQNSAGVEEGDSKSVAEFKRSHTNFRSQWSFPEDFPNAEVLSAFAMPEVDRSLEPFAWAAVETSRIVAQLLEAADLPGEKVLERLDPALRRYQDTLRQPRISEYMVPSDGGEVALVRSSRMRNALRGLRGEASLSPERSPATGDRGQTASTGSRPRRGRGRGQGARTPGDGHNAEVEPVAASAGQGEAVEAPGRGGRGRPRVAVAPKKPGGKNAARGSNEENEAASHTASNAEATSSVSQHAMAAPTGWARLRAVSGPGKRIDLDSDSDSNLPGAEL
ncbi:unnamed protein product [Polarella glacialis]|uniref:DNA repair protein RAD2 n=1 Tax=Polarella glacialis TaxID=89957 RepID=A0A813ITL1_POLGL|nr:unnamed protein product [Polarella glacialis]